MISKTQIPIRGDKLAKRWGLIPIDLFFIMWNHDLKVIDQNGNLLDVNEVLNAIPQNERDKSLDVETWYFSLTEIETLEKDSILESLPIKHNLIRGKNLMEKWDMDEFEIYTIVSQNGWDFFDPFGIPIGHEFFLAMCAHGNFNISDGLFRKSDVEDFEKEDTFQYYKKDEILVDSPAAGEKTNDQEDIPVISFYKDGQVWLIGPKGKEKIFQHYVGFEFIRFLLRYPEKRHDSAKVYYIGNIPDELKGHLYEKDFHKFSDPKTIKKILQFKSRLEEELKETIDYEHQQELDSKIKKCKEYLKEANNSFSGSSEKYRTKVLNGIKRAIETIERESNKSKFLESVLENLQLKNPHRRIFTGNSCCYTPNSEAPVAWQLDPPFK